MIVKLQITRDDGTVVVDVRFDAFTPTKWSANTPIREGARGLVSFDYTPHVKLIKDDPAPK